MGRKCSVESCFSDSGRSEDAGVTFHKVPIHSDIRPKWFSLCRISNDKKNVKVIYVCSRHFLRADFCNFKGKKYMLRQGVLPSVFPWDKSKLEAIKVKIEKPDGQVESAKEPIKTGDQIKLEPAEKINFEPTEIKNEPESSDESPMHASEPMEVDTTTNEDQTDENKLIPDNEIKVEDKSAEEKKEDEKVKCTSASGINFSIDSKLEALDFNNIWYPARIVEVDYEENEVLIHFEKFSSKFDEWICMDSPRLRPLQPPGKKTVAEEFAVGERCSAAWSDSRKFPATVTKIVGNDVYEVLFDDGYMKTLKGHRMTKAQGKAIQSSPLFDPIQSSKQDRRDKKRKLNVAALFNKRVKVSNSNTDRAKPCTIVSAAPAVPEEETFWVPTWENGRPVGVDAMIETHDGQRSSVIVADPKLPEGWVKHLVQRIHGTSAGKWDTIIVGPDGKRFRTKSEIKTYLENHPEYELHETMFDFSLHRQRQRKSIPAEKKPPVLPPVPEVEDQTSQESQSEDTGKGDNSNALKIIFVNDAYKCPIEGCGKNFRKENLAQMHVKHYHKEYTKYLDSTPNVADLAYARTVGENLEKSPGPTKPPPSRAATKSVTPKVAKLPQSPTVEPEIKCESPLPKAKDAEIIKLLASNPFDKKEPESIQPLPSGLPANMYPDVKLRDLLSDSEAMPKRDDLNLKSLCSARPPVGIKTLLPVRPASDNKVDDAGKKLLKRKQGISENREIVKGGEVIKIVRMKQEEIINCTCGITEEDGLMIQCELCLCWQHAYCNNIEKESQVPEKYICYICQNPLRERASKKYFHDQDWLKHGVLPTGSYHSKDEEELKTRFSKLKQLHDVSGAIVELKEFLNSTSIKLKIAEAKNHPKLYLWSKPWEKQPLPEKLDVKQELKEETTVQPENDDHQYVKNETEVDKTDAQNDRNDSMLMMILKAGKDLSNMNSLMDNNAPIIPKAEATVDSMDCKLNLLDHIAHIESLTEERIDELEKIVDTLEAGMELEDDPDNVKTKQTLQLLIRDLGTLKEFSQLSTI
ncbi:PHD finger protein 20 isoform X3 [Aethina tumida]|uniref:PHD finger protein 20 isoform X3 n=1 Tax=Aethina tumida TaxID=116153 RepID=UPI00096AED2D|nr:PHD finger protein 20 isoform X3 [Aethina tumida]